MLIEDGENGLITPCGDVDSFSSALAKLLADQSLSDKYGSKAVRIREKLNTESIAKEWEDYFCSVVKN